MKNHLLAVVALFSLTQYTSAFPAETKRTVGGIKIYTSKYWTGTCGYKVQPLNMCIHLHDPWYHTISSFGPDQGTTCNWYSDYNCNTHIACGIVYPEIDNMNHPAPGCQKRSEDGLEKRCHGNQAGSFKY
ncbi:Nn.00g032290.m01.CDS01 [Neocucurbitaria sp. VM-36]